MNRSESQCLAILETQGENALSPDEVYRAYVVLANNGLSRDGEEKLGSNHRALLEARRLIKAGKTEEAKEIVERVEAATPLLLGDRSFLLAALHHRQGKIAEAGRLYAEASEFYDDGKDERRRLRAKINSLVCQNEVVTYIVGPLFALEQEARRGGFHDLVGITTRGRAIELIKLGRFEEASVEAESSVESFSIDGCPEDLALARLLAAIAKLAMGDLENAKKQFGRVHMTSGRLATYQAVYESLLAGKKPKTPKGHPLESTSWPRFSVKHAAIPAKILRRLQAGAATPNELIEEVWGKDAIHPSYRNRLFVALNKLKKSVPQSIVFDGESYRLK
jgi:tetratricopeptide (TPR) repeat protein